MRAAEHQARRLSSRQPAARHWHGCHLFITYVVSPVFRTNMKPQNSKGCVVTPGDRGGRRLEWHQDTLGERRRCWHGDDAGGGRCCSSKAQTVEQSRNIYVRLFFIHPRRDAAGGHGCKIDVPSFDDVLLMHFSCACRGLQLVIRAVLLMYENG